MNSILAALNPTSQEIDMSLSRTRSLMNNINGASTSASNESYLSQVQDNSNHLPPLKTGQVLDDAALNSHNSQQNKPTKQNPGNNISTAVSIPNQILPSVITQGELLFGSHGTNQASNGSTKPKAMVATPDQVLKLYFDKLTPYEAHEIFSYQEIYFIGANASKRPGLTTLPYNYGYDNEQGSYIHIPHDHVGYRYEVLKVIGKGSFGQVVKAYDHKFHEHVALKIVRNEKRFHRQAQEEIRILDHLKRQDTDNTMNIIHMYNSFTFRSHMCITFELLSINMYELIRRSKFQGFSLTLVRKFSHSLLQCLNALHRNKIIHCDMKPENVLLKQQGRSGIKVS